MRFKPTGITQRVFHQLDQKDVTVLITPKPRQLSYYQVQIMALHTFVAPQAVCSHTVQQRGTSTQSIGDRQAREFFDQGGLVRVNSDLSF